MPARARIEWFFAMSFPLGGSGEVPSGSEWEYTGFSQCHFLPEVERSVFKPRAVCAAFEYRASATVTVRLLPRVLPLCFPLALFISHLCPAAASYSCTAPPLFNTMEELANPIISPNDDREYRAIRLTKNKLKVLLVCDKTAEKVQHTNQLGEKRES